MILHSENFDGSDYHKDLDIVYKYIIVDNISIGYREAGVTNKPVILLLHGYPSSSFMFRNIIPLLAVQFHVIAPDLPGFGFSEIPSSKRFDYSFAGYSNIIERFVDEMRIKRASFYLFDYGAPILMRLITKRSELVDMLIFQNGNIYQEGVGDVLKKTRKLFDDDTPESHTELTKLFELEYTKWEYLNGVGDASKVAPETYILDQFLLDRKDVKDIQKELKNNYKTNIDLYPHWQKWLKDLQPPTLIVWGENDEIFTKEGALMLKEDLHYSKLLFYPTGHFALEEYGRSIAHEIILFWNYYFKN